MKFDYKHVLTLIVGALLSFGVVSQTDVCKGVTPAATVAPAAVTK